MTRRKRVQLETKETCVKCGEELPAGMTAYQLSGELGEGYEHYGKCRGVLRAELDLRDQALKTKSDSELLKLCKQVSYGNFIPIIDELIQRAEKREGVM